MNKKIIVVGICILIINLLLGGNVKTFSVTSKIYKESNKNLVLDKILNDNELKQEIPHMFNYTSNGMQNSFDKVDPNYITEGLYSNSDEDGTTYYYRGDIDNNNIVFGAYDEDYYVFYYKKVTEYGDGIDLYFQSLETCQEYNSNCSVNDKVKLASKGDKMHWKIIRVNGDGSLRLIYNGPGFKGDFMPTSFGDEELSGFVGFAPYNFDTSKKESAGYTYNGTDSFIKREVDTWYNNTLGSNNNYDSKVILGRFCNDTSGTVNGESFYFASGNRLEQSDNNFTKDNQPTFICPETTESYGGSYNLKAGLITADELAFAGEMDAIAGNSYLNPRFTDMYWTMTPSSYYLSLSDDYRVTMKVFRNSFLTINVDLASSIRPVINIKTDNMSLTGDGTEDNPYQLEEITNNNYKGTVTIEEGSSVDDNTAFEEELNLDGVNWTSNDESIARIENGKILGLKEGTTTITGVSSDGLTTYLIEVTIIKNPVTNSMIYVSIGVILILVLGTILYTVYRIKKLSE